MTESLTKTMKIHDVHLLEVEGTEDFIEQPPHFIQKYSARRLHSLFGHLSPGQCQKQHAQPLVTDAT